MKIKSVAVLGAGAVGSYVIWGQTLSALAWVGMALIVAAGTLIALRARAQEG